MITTTVVGRSRLLVNLPVVCANATANARYGAFGRVACRNLSTSGRTASRHTAENGVRHGSLAAFSGGLLLGYYLGSGSSSPLKPQNVRKIYAYLCNNLGMPLLRMLDAETAHSAAIRLASWGLAPKDGEGDDPILATSVMGMSLDNPIGLAAGFDKHAEAVDGLIETGFGFVEIGSVTPEPQLGNPKPRMFRLSEDEGVINRCGFNSHGLAAVRKRLSERAVNPSPLRKGLLGVNVGKNKLSEDAAADYCRGIRTLGCYGDYLVVNVSSPNTPGLRALQRRGAIKDIIQKAMEARDEVVESTAGKPLPLLVKIAPDLSEEEKADIATVAMETKVDGLIVSNTTISRPESLQSQHAKEGGGLSGAPLKDLSTQTVHDVYRLTKGKVPLIGVGGVGSGRDAYEKIRAGASLVQVYSMLVYQGPGMVPALKKELATLLRKDGFKSVAEAVGADHHNTVVGKKKEGGKKAESGKGKDNVSS